MQLLKLKLASFLLLPRSTASLTFPQWHDHNARPVLSFTFESIFNFSLIHSQPVSSKTLNLAKISFCQTMQWIKGHTRPLSCSRGDQTHFWGQELLTNLFNLQEKLGIRDKYMPMEVGSEPTQTKVLGDRTRQMVFFFFANLLNFSVRGFREGWGRNGWNILLYTSTL